MVHRQSGKIVFVGSVAGKVPIPFRSAFSASKHSLQAFADALRAEVAMYHVKVLVSSPEYIAVDLSDDDICTAGTADESKQICVHILLVSPTTKLVIAPKIKASQSESIFAAQEKGFTPLGDPPQQIADQLLLAVLRDYKEDVTLSFQFAYWLRVTCPSFYHFMIARRAEQAILASIPQAPERY